MVVGVAGMNITVAAHAAILSAANAGAECSTLSDSSNSASHYANEYDDQTSRAGSFSNPPHDYEVFLSFSGDDTRYSFTNHLYNALVNRNINVFRDSENLHVGQKIDQLLKAIGTSKILVPIISTHYASSKWCLKELVQILKCNRQLARLVLPIFYGVKPSDVREQKGQFGEEFQRFKERHSNDTNLVRESKQAFKDIVSLKGWELEKFAKGYEVPLVQAVVERIFKELRKPILDVPDFLVGVEEHVKELMKEIDAKQSNDAKIIAIHGMGGIGKTTLAKVLYNELFDYFESRSFVPNIHEASSTYKGVVNLQKQVISDVLLDKPLKKISRVDDGKAIIKNCIKGKRLLLVLHDVSEEDQLKKLAVENNMFASESIVIITTRNKDVTVASADYELNELDKNQSYKFLCKHVFGKDASCPSNLEDRARGIVSTTGGLPIAIEVIGCLLYRKGDSFWSSTLEKLRRIPDDKVLNRLMGTPNIQALELYPRDTEIHFTSQQFEGMKNLRFLNMPGMERLTGDFENLFSNMIWLRWGWWSSVYIDLMGINFNPKKLVILELNDCNITEHWKGWNQVKNLKVLSLSFCNHLTTTPDFSAVKGLEELVLSDCDSLKKIHPSIGKFRKTLKVLNVQCCYELDELPRQVWEMEELRELVICGNGIRTKGSLLKLPVLRNLRHLDLEDCKELESLPNLPSSLSYLRFNGDSMETLPDFANLTNLKYLCYKDVF